MRARGNNFAWLMGTCALALCSQTAPVYAQAASATGSTGIEEVTVTAQRRAENQQSVPIALTAVSNEELKARQVISPSDLAKSVPSLNYNSIFGYATPFIRGIGNANVSIGDEPSVATYVDGVYQISGTVSAGLPFNNIDHVEVLDGPQGTLYGRNATGGLINIVTKEPSDTPTAELDAGYGNYNTFQGDAYLADGIADGVSADLAIRYQHQQDGYIRNDFNGKDVGRDNFFAARSKWHIEFNDRVSLDLSGDYENDSNSYATTPQNYPGSVPITALIPGTIFSDKPWHTEQNANPVWTVHSYGFSGKLMADLGFANFVSITAYRHVEQINQLTNDASSADGPFAITSPDPRIGTVTLPTLYDKETQKTPFGYTQEFQLMSKDDTRLTWIGGVFLLDTRVQYDPLLLYSASTDKDPFLVFGGPGETARAVGIYGQASYNVTDALKLTGGLRYSGEQRTMDGYQDIPSLSSLTTTNKSTYFQGLSYHFAADYHFTNSFMVYASASRGFKSGLYNGSAIDDSAAVKPETLDDYEVGFKSDLTDRVRLNGSAFWYNYKDKQEFGIAANGTGSLQNAPKAQLYGGELDLDTVPIDNLKISAGLALEHSEYTDFPDAQIYVPSEPYGPYPNAGYAIVSANVKGNQIERTPDFTFNTNAEYTVNLDEAGSILFAADYYHTAKFAWDASDLYWQKAYDLFDASATWTSESGKWDVSLWGKNLGNKAYGQALVIGQRSLGEAYAPPRTFGIKIGWKTD
jgi:iron complex outermembrane recepter protein